MVDQVAIHHLQVTLEQGLHHEGMTYGGICKIPCGLHIPNVGEILLGAEDRPFLLLTLQDIGTVTNLHGFLIIIIKTVEVQQSDLLTLIQQELHIG